MLLFDSTMLIGGGAVVAVALLDKAAEEFGYHWLGTIAKIILPIAGLVACIYFIETMPILRWIL